VRAESTGPLYFAIFFWYQNFLILYSIQFLSLFFTFKKIKLKQFSHVSPKWPSAKEDLAKSGYNKNTEVENLGNQSYYLAGH
jgi:hypothetical protein